MPNSRKLNRRRFLEATGAAALTASMAGCAEDGGEGEQTTTEEGEGEYTPSDTYPYGANETNVEEAKAVMEEAGYGPDNRFELDWVQYQSPAWEEMANTIRSRLDSAYIDMNISDADFGALLNQTEKGEHMAYTLGWIADYPAAQNFLQLIDPENTIYDAEGYTPNGSRLFWSEDAMGDDRIREYMTAQFDRIQNNPQNTEEAQEIRNDAGIKMEKAMWDSAGLIPIYHRVDQLFWYDHVDYDAPGGMGPSRSKENIAVNDLGGKETFNGISATFNSLDPIASGNTASGGKVMNMFDAPMNYHNGTTDVRSLLVEDYSVSDDATEFEFTLKEGMQFHGDYGEITADDLVYSIQRLVESPNSTNTYFPLSVLAIDHEKDEDGNVVPGSTAIEKTGTYSFKITLQNPFAHTLSVLAYSAFSAVPEGIVADIEGYEDGDMVWEDFSTNPVGSGPFVFEEWQSGNGGVFRASKFEDYHGPEPVMDELHDSIITEPTASYNYFLNENADVSGIPTEQYDPDKVTIEEEEGSQSFGTYGPIGDGKTVNMSATPSINTFFVGFNMEKVPKPVRQAMAYVINHEQFIANVFKGRGEEGFHLTPPAAFPSGASTYYEYIPE
ncbi:ABC transporter substrate-binding protein [Halodesulfurarchaeum sp.]|uniref:ABC transporter substrate-binding protein n=1 Tax=Halodesulfurarchaeum sp. TaxID=1980530 RepID=UPI001BC2AC68|nr:peptide ABC transporter substrate-binding protein [Halodesulfurarchaeum sp.]